MYVHIGAKQALCPLNDAFGDDGIGFKRQMRPVLLGCAKRQDGDSLF